MTLPAKPHAANVWLLCVFCTSLALYPPLSQFAAPVIALSFAAMLSVALFGVFFLALPVRGGAALYGTVGLLFVVFAVWLFVAILFGNDMTYMMLDSQGFVIYLLAPVLFAFIRTNRLEAAFTTFLLNLSIFLAVISAGIIIWYYWSFGAVESESLLLMNAVLKSYNLNWQIEHNGGFLGLYTYTGHLLLIGVGLAFYRYVQSGKAINLGLILLFAFGMFADGHRALVVAFVLLLAMFMPLIKKIVGLKRMLVFVGVLAALMLVVALAGSEWLLERFSFTADDPSTLERFLQVPALLDKIGERPLFGSGFGSFARVIRSDERPFSYEVDFLATWMKLGLVGSLMYFGAYLYMLNRARVAGGTLGYILFSVGVAFFFYMGTNGNSAMSTDSSVFHLFLFVLIALAIPVTPHAAPASASGGGQAQPARLDE